MANPFLAGLAGFGHGEHPFLVNDRIELPAHVLGLGLRLYVVAINDASAIGIRAGAIAARHRAARLFRRRLDNLKRTDTIR